jgi:hypothetical protein
MQNKNAGITFIIAVLIAGHLIGTMTHILNFSEVIKLGFIQSAKAYGVSPIINGYWLSLTIIDPAIAFLLIKKRKTGVLLAFVNIFINVIVNSSVQISILPAVTLHSIYDSLGNIFNGLQIALLIFSAFTLPLFYGNPDERSPGRINYVWMFSFIPIIALSAGLIIHIAGLIQLVNHFESFWTLWVHVSMILFDGGLLYALWKRMRLGYLVGIVGFSLFGLLQGGFAVAIFMGVKCGFNLIMAVTISICCLAISALMINSEKYNKQKFYTEEF